MTPEQNTDAPPVETIAVLNGAGDVVLHVPVPRPEDDQAAYGMVEDGEHIAFRCSDTCTLQINGGRITCGSGTSPACADAPPEA